MINYVKFRRSSNFIWKQKMQMPPEFWYKKKGELGLWDFYHTNELQSIIIM
jgi:hypothetical protein